MNYSVLLVIESSGTVGEVGLYRIKDADSDWLRRSVSPVKDARQSRVTSESIESLATESLDPQAGMAANLVPTIQKILSEQNVTASGLTGIAVTNGPGSFTSLRVGVVTAKTMAYALQSDSRFSVENQTNQRRSLNSEPVLLAVNTLEAIAYEGFGCLNANHFPEQSMGIRVWPVLNAYRKQLFTSAYEIDVEFPNSANDHYQLSLNLRSPAMKSRCVKTSEFTELVSNESRSLSNHSNGSTQRINLIHGPGVKQLKETDEFHELTVNAHPEGIYRLGNQTRSIDKVTSVDLNSVAVLAVEQYKRRRFVDPFELQPDYLRQSAAEEKRDGR